MSEPSAEEVQILVDSLRTLTVTNKLKLAASMVEMFKDTSDPVCKVSAQRVVTYLLEKSLAEVQLWTPTKL